MGRLAGQIAKGNRKRQQPSELITDGRKVGGATKGRKVTLRDLRWMGKGRVGRQHAVELSRW